MLGIRKIQDLSAVVFRQRRNIMFRGVLALFRSGAIFDPFVLSGILMGLITVFSKNKETFEALYKNNSFYLLILLLGFLYNFFFKKVYQDDGETLNYLVMGWNILMSLVKFVISCAFSIVFVMMLFSF